MEGFILKGSEMQIMQEWFHNKQFYEAFLYAVSLVEKIKDAQSKGAIVYDGKEMLTGEWIIDLNPEEPSIGIKEGNCTFGYVGWTWNERSNKTYCTKKEVKESFKNISWVYPKYFNKLF